MRRNPFDQSLMFCFCARDFTLCVVSLWSTANTGKHFVLRSLATNSIIGVTAHKAKTWHACAWRYCVKSPLVDSSTFLHSHWSVLPAAFIAGHLQYGCLHWRPSPLSRRPAQVAKTRPVKKRFAPTSAGTEKEERHVPHTKHCSWWCRSCRIWTSKTTQSELTSCADTNKQLGSSLPIPTRPAKMPSSRTDSMFNF